MDQANQRALLRGAIRAELRETIAAAEEVDEEMLLMQHLLVEAHPGLV